MLEESFSKQDKRFIRVIIYAFRAITFVAYVGIVGILIFAGWAWKTGWKEVHEILWPTIGTCILCAGSIWGSNLLKKLLLHRTPAEAPGVTPEMNSEN
jgi:hypothetical protein